MLRSIVAATLFSAVMACPQHGDDASGSHVKRADGPGGWSYGASYDWAKVDETYTLCEAGAQQSPIGLTTGTGYAAGAHRPTFNYPNTINGSLYNWGFGPAFNPAGTDITKNPSMTFDGQTFYLKGWHIHTPSEHTVDHYRPKAELHLVHASADGVEKAVVGIMLDPVTYSSRAVNSSFFNSVQLQRVPSFKDTTSKVPARINIKQILTEAGNFKDYWTYEGSFTTPPCRQGLRWFVSSSKVLLGTEQMMRLLKVSAYSVRAEQGIWGHNVNI